jgi:uncharacterized membrane protein YhaH (DUF805 family)
MEWMILPLKRYVDFQGRSRRKEFWLWVVFLVVVSIVLSILDSVLGLGGRSSLGRTPGLAPGNFGYGAYASGGVLTGIFSLAVLIPHLAVQVRRLHDTNRSGWWLLSPIVPYALGFTLIIAGAAGANPALAFGGGILALAGSICAIVVLVFFCLSGTAGPNRFGPDPVRGEADLADTFR